ncbi:hypothetical protein PT974_02445 [Cladobotryum mycophilum]|uniref:GET complex subunit GET2 n=1 Tax=Cladobotryum mycophilum TaxID=491253 RepID=A0ABR0SY45_9HYPO
MADVTTTSSDAAAQRAAEQARLRKERREAKIKSGGSARLNRITGMGGRVTGDSEPTADSAPAPVTITASPPSPFPPAAPAAKPQVPVATHKDPEEVDISQHYYAPQATTRRVPPPAAASPVPEGPNLSDVQLRQMMLGLDRPQQQTPVNGAGASPQQEEDPIMKMMSQMMGGNMPGGASPFAGMPIPQQQTAVQPPTRSVTVWRILHALFAIGLGIFFAFTTPFTGSKIERELSVIAYDARTEEEDQRQKIFFWAFATAEVLLLSSRFLFDKASTRSTGFVATALSYLPQPYRGYLEVGQRYVQIFNAVRSDLLTCIFVLGVCTWLKA